METLLSLSIALIGGLLLSRLTKKLDLPAVTAYLVAGILFGIATGDNGAGIAASIGAYAACGLASGIA